ncbi:MAG: CHC2 zinc finger domain-containing protein [bacterium]
MNRASEKRKGTNAAKKSRITAYNENIIEQDKQNPERIYYLERERHKQKRTFYGNKYKEDKQEILRDLSEGVYRILTHIKNKSGICKKPKKELRHKFSDWGVTDCQIRQYVQKCVNARFPHRSVIYHIDRWNDFMNDDLGAMLTYLIDRNYWFYKRMPKDKKWVFYYLKTQTRLGILFTRYEDEFSEDLKERLLKALKPSIRKLLTKSREKHPKDAEKAISEFKGKMRNFVKKQKIKHKSEKQSKLLEIKGLDEKTEKGKNEPIYKQNEEKLTPSVSNTPYIYRQSNIPFRNKFFKEGISGSIEPKGNDNLVGGFLGECENIDRDFLGRDENQVRDSVDVLVDNSLNQVDVRENLNVGSEYSLGRDVSDSDANRGSGDSFLGDSLELAQILKKNRVENDKRGFGSKINGNLKGDFCNIVKIHENSQEGCIEAIKRADCGQAAHSPSKSFFGVSAPQIGASCGQRTPNIEEITKLAGSVPYKTNLKDSGQGSGNGDKLTGREDKSCGHQLADLDYKDFYSHYLKLEDRELSNGDVKALCPFHSDTDPSMSVNLKTGKWFCFGGCNNSGGHVYEFLKKIYEESNQEEQFKTYRGMVDFIKLGLWKEWKPEFSYSPLAQLEFEGRKHKPKALKKIKATEHYTYESFDSTIKYKKTRYDFEDGSKSFKFENREGFSIFYNESNVVKALKAGEDVYVFEGERKANWAIDNGLTATCLDTGANSKWNQRLIDLVKNNTAGSTFILVPDNDKAGEQYVENFMIHLGGIVKLKTVHLSVGDGEDILDFIKQGNTIEEFTKLCKMSTF